MSLARSFLCHYLETKDGGIRNSPVGGYCFRVVAACADGSSYRVSPDEYDQDPWHFGLPAAYGTLVVNFCVSRKFNPMWDS